MSTSYTASVIAGVSLKEVIRIETQEILIPRFDSYTGKPINPELKEEYRVFLGTREITDQISIKEDKSYYPASIESRVYGALGGIEGKNSLLKMDLFSKGSEETVEVLGLEVVSCRDSYGDGTVSFTTNDIYKKLDEVKAIVSEWEIDSSKVGLYLNLHCSY